MRLHAIALWTFAAVLMFCATTTTAAAQGAACNGIPLNESASGEPGEQLADAIGDQGDEIGNELDDRAFDARLANATSNESRARIIAAETERIAGRLDTLEACWESLQSSGEGEEVDAQDVAVLRRHVNSIQERVNEIEHAAAGLPPSVRSEFGIDADSMAALHRRVAELRAALPQSVE